MRLDLDAIRAEAVLTDEEFATKRAAIVDQL